MAFAEAQEQVRDSLFGRGTERDLAVSCIGNIDRALFFPHPEKASAGILRVAGWCGADKSAFSGRLRGELVHGAVMEGAFRTPLNREDVLAVWPNLNLQCGFDAIFETERAVADGDAIELRFFADGALCHVLQGTVCDSRVAAGAERDVAVFWIGNIDRAFFFPHPEKASAGILRITGWCGADKSAFNGRLRGELVHGAVMDGAFRTLLNREDILAEVPNLNLQCGFDAIFETERAVADGDAIELKFFADGALCHVLRGAVRDPRVAVEARKSALSDLRRKKLDNLILNEAERLAHVSRARSFPVTGQIDPSFACNLECPHCLSEMIRRDGFNIPVLKNDQMNEILDTYGPYLIRIWLSFWGEPLLNRALPEIVKRCKKFEIWTLISSNMSVPLKDEQIDAIVASGLDSIVLSIDGATQATYETYRKKGNLSLVLKNARKFVEAKRRLGSTTPYLYWRYLHFPWNGHEIDAAREIAAEIGIDEFDIYPGILTPDQKHSHDMRPEVEDLQEMPADLQRYLRNQASERRSAKHYFGCDYLYQSISVNSNGMVHPCCYVVSPMHSVGFAVDSKDSVRNHRVMTSSRELFGKLASESTETVQGYDPCVGCPIMQSTEGHTETQTFFSELFNYLLYDRKIAR